MNKEQNIDDILKQLKNSYEGDTAPDTTAELSSDNENIISHEELQKKYEDRISPAIILIPGVKNNTGEGMRSVSRSVEKAVGSQLPD